MSLKTKTAKTFDVIFGGKEKSKISSTKKLSRQAEKILSAMEEMAKNPLITLPTLNHGYFYTAGSRITLYGDKKRWAVVFEKSGFQNRGGGVLIEITYLSNCLLYTNVNELNNDSLDNVKTIKIVEDRELFNILEDDLIISPKTKYITVRGQRLPVTRDKEEYRRCQINLEDPNILEIYNLIRLYDKKYPQIFRATEAEQRNCLPVDLPLIMSINQWHQPDCDFLDLPDFQSCETFRQIATVLSSLDSNCWQPSEAPNNNWQNWPDAGTL